MGVETQCGNIVGNLGHVAHFTVLLSLNRNDVERIILNETEMTRSTSGFRPRLPRRSSEEGSNAKEDAYSIPSSEGPSASSGPQSCWTHNVQPCVIRAVGDAPVPRLHSWIS